MSTSLYVSNALADTNFQLLITTSPLLDSQKFIIFNKFIYNLYSDKIPFHTDYKRLMKKCGRYNKT